MGMKTPTLDKYSLHGASGYCTCFSNPYGRCMVCKAIREQQKRWAALTPEVRAKAEAEAEAVVEVGRGYYDDWGR